MTVISFHHYQVLPFHLMAQQSEKLATYSADQSQKQESSLNSFSFSATNNSIPYMATDTLKNNLSEKIHSKIKPEPLLTGFLKTFKRQRRRSRSVPNFDDIFFPGKKSTLSDKVVNSFLFNASKIRLPLEVEKYGPL